MKKWLIPCLMLMMVWTTPVYAGNLATVEIRSHGIKLEYNNNVYSLPLFNVNFVRMDRDNKKYYVGITGYYNDGGTKQFQIDKETYGKIQRLIFKTEQ